MERMLVMRVVKERWITMVEADGNTSISFMLFSKYRRKSSKHENLIKNSTNGKLLIKLE